jgi:hypothetical protein
LARTIARFADGFARAERRTLLDAVAAVLAKVAAAIHVRRANFADHATAAKREPARHDAAAIVRTNAAATYAAAPGAIFTGLPTSATLIADASIAEVRAAIGIRGAHITDLRASDRRVAYAVLAAQVAAFDGRAARLAHGLALDSTASGPRTPAARSTAASAAPRLARASAVATRATVRCIEIVRGWCVTASCFEHHARGYDERKR